MPPGFCTLRGTACEPGPCSGEGRSATSITLPGPGRPIWIDARFRNFNLTEDGRRFAEEATGGLLRSGYSYVVRMTFLPEGSEIPSFKTNVVTNGPQAVVATQLWGFAGRILNPTFPQANWGRVELEVYVEQYGPLGMEFEIKIPDLPVQKVKFAAEPVWTELYNRDSSIRRPPPR